MYIHLCICIHDPGPTAICIYIYIYIYLFIDVSISFFICLFICLYIYIYMYVYISLAAFLQLSLKQRHHVGRKVRGDDVVVRHPAATRGGHGQVAHVALEVIPPTTQILFRRVQVPNILKVSGSNNHRFPRCSI